MATKAPEAPSRDELIADLMIANAAAKVTRPSPAWNVQHQRINELLDELVGA